MSLYDPKVSFPAPEQPPCERCDRSRPVEQTTEGFLCQECSDITFGRTLINSARDSGNWSGVEKAGKR